jgi:lipopolysaccharide assembly protein A
MRLLKYVFLGLVGLALISLAVTNRDPVTVRLMPEMLAAVLGLSLTATVPLFVVIFAAVLMGVVLGFIWEWLREHKFRVEASAKRREAAKLKTEVDRLRSTGVAEDDEILALIEKR